MHTFKEYLAELLDKKPAGLTLAHERAGKSKIYELNADGNKITFTIARHAPGWWVFYFKGEDENGDETFSSNGKGGEFKIFAASKWIIGDIIHEYAPLKIELEGEIDDEADDPMKRVTLYRKFLKKYTPSGYTVVEKNNEGQSMYFTLVKKGSILST